MKTFYLLLFLPFLGSGQTQIGADIYGSHFSDRFGDVVALSSDGNTIATKANWESYNTKVRVFRNLSGVWTQIGADIIGSGTFDGFGDSIAISADGTIVAIGAPRLNNDRGFVRMLKNIDNNWIQIGTDINGEAAGNYSGDSVSLSADGSIVAIGAIGNSDNGLNSGHVRVYQNIANTWTQIGDDINGNGVNYKSGRSISLSADGSIVAIGATGYSSGSGPNAGQVRVYKNITNIWTQIGNNINDSSQMYYFGNAVSLSADGTKLAVGAPNYNSTAFNGGKVRIYQYQGSNWALIGVPINGGNLNDFFGANLSLSADGSLVAIGADGANPNGSNSGQVRIYKNINNSWIKIGTDINGVADEDYCGTSLSLSADGSILAVGAPGNNTSSSAAGQIRVYSLSLILKSDSFVLDSFSIYPNPVSDIINIDLNENLELQKANIYATSGQLLKTENSKKFKINDLATGTYFIEVITNKGKATKTIIVK